MTSFVGSNSFFFHFCNWSTKVAVYDASGVELGAAVSRGGKTLVPAHIASSSIAIVKIGEKSVKVAVK
ncbi:MAG: hypothetical protein IKQ03_10345 [Prevotella sp.]|nr:hypothetical protein [Prevotella sp.]